jgi:inward rectifier potassium channel
VAESDADRCRLPSTELDPSETRVTRTAVADNNQASEVVIVGATAHPWRDLYHVLLTVRWWGAIAAIVFAFLVVNLVFACAYYAAGGVEGAHPGSFADAFFFSAQTLGTIGYGALHPATMAANLIAVGESIVGILFAAVSTGIVFARFSRSTESLVFSNNPCISLMNGTPTLSLRVGNDREGAVLEAHVRVALVRTERTAEGVVMYRMYDLVLARERTPALARTWTVLHTIDEKSPLYGATPESCLRDEVELVVTVVGTDSTTLQPVHGRMRYVSPDLKWGARLADILTERPDGRLELDVRRFHELVETEPTEGFPYPPRVRGET